jgi:hypothetical protein
LVVPGDVPDLGEEDSRHRRADPGDRAKEGGGRERGGEADQFGLDLRDARLDAEEPRREIGELEGQGERHTGRARGERPALRRRQ